MLKKDNMALGALIGLILPALLYGLLKLISLFVETGTTWTRPFEPDRMLILSLLINVIPIRLYFVTYKFEKTGRGVLLATFLLMVASFLFIRFT
jgi:hypothetical protein